MSRNPLVQAAHWLTLLPRFHQLGLAALGTTLAVLAFNQNDGPNGDSLEEITLVAKAEASALPAAMLSAPNADASVVTTPITESTPIQNELPAQAAIAAVEEALAAEPEQSPLIQKTEKVKSGDTLAHVFKRAGVDAKYMYHLLHGHKKAKSLARIYPGHELTFTQDENGKLLSLEHAESQLSKQVFTRVDDSYEHETIERTPDIKLVRTEGTITHSLYGAAKEANLEDRLTMSLAGIFGWDVDFALDIRENDSFIVVFEEKYLDGEFLGTGNIIAAEFTNQGKTFRAVRYTDAKGDSQYYTPEGDTMRKAFLRTPIDFARISSHFNLNRKHPVLNTIRAHKGTDYAAPRGTPIKAAGDGKVIFAGRKGGYGNTLIIQHGQTYQTLYAHLHKFGKNVKRGSSVKQGQVVAYVGTTGLSTGPHLHYEFRVNGAVRNPVTVKLPKADPVPKAERERFFAQTRELVAKLEPSSKEPTQIASQEQDSETTSM